MNEKGKKTIHMNSNASWTTLLSESSSIITSSITVSQEELEEIFSQLFVDRHGDVPNSNMTTTSLERLIDPAVLYEFDLNHGITEASEIHSSNISKIRCFKSRNTLPPSLKYVTFVGDWDDTPGTPDFTNILGGNGHLIVDTVDTKITVPLVAATEETLSYYKAHLIASGDQFRFQTNRKFPIFTMEIGKNYVREFVMKEGHGLYLEYHNEPHFHQPMNSSSSGSYLLAKKVGVSDEGLDVFHMTAFEIPHGYAVYTEPGAIHDDATTQGTWRVGYINAQTYSTVLLSNKVNDVLEIAFEFERPQLLPDWNEGDGGQEPLQSLSLAIT